MKAGYIMYPAFFVIGVRITHFILYSSKKALNSSFHSDKLCNNP